jgi:hypothetical protein
MTMRELSSFLSSPAFPSFRKSASAGELQFSAQTYVFNPLPFGIEDASGNGEFKPDFWQ